jgi:hypothetical protein
VAGVEDEDAVVEQLVRGETLAVGLALDETREDIALGIARATATIGDEADEIVEELAHSAVAAVERSLCTGSCSRSAWYQGKGSS